MKPDVNDVHVSSLLTEISVGFEPGGFIADQAFPVVGVDKQFDSYATYNRSDWARDENRPAAGPAAELLLRSPATMARRGGFGVSTNTFRAENYAIGMDLPDELVANADDAFDIEADAARYCQTQMRILRDVKFTTDFMTTGVWGTDATISNKWSDYGAGTPIEDLRTQLRVVRRGSLAGAGGRITVVMGALVWDRLADHPDFLDRVKYSERGVFGPDLLGSLLGVSSQGYPVDVLVGLSVVTNDEEGTAEASVTYTDIWDDDVLILWRPNSPGRAVPAAGYTFVWRPLVGGGNAVEFVRRYRQEKIRATSVECHVYFDQAAVSTPSGVFISDAVD